MNRKTKWIVPVVVIALLAMIFSLHLLAKPPAPRSPTPSSPLALATPTALLLSSSLAPVVSVAPFLQATSTQPKITWSPTSSIEVILSPGESTAKDLTFRSDQALQNPIIEAVPEIAGFLSIQPSTIVSLPAGQLQAVHISIAIPVGTAFGTYNGTIHVRIGAQTLPQTVKVILNVWQTLTSTSLGFSIKYPSSLTVRQLYQAVAFSSIPEPQDLEGDAGDEILVTARPAGTFTDTLSWLYAYYNGLIDFTITPVERFSNPLGIPFVQIRHVPGSFSDNVAAYTVQGGTIFEIALSPTQTLGDIYQKILSTFLPSR